jgi:hypothetical protein
METTDAERAKRNHPVPAQLLLDGMKSIIVEGKEKEFLESFASAFVLASKEDIGKLKIFLRTHGAANNPMNLAARNVVGSDRC